MNQLPFPFNSLVALQNLSEMQLQQNLQFYGLQVPHGLTNRRKRLALYIGCSIAFWHSLPNAVIFLGFHNLIPSFVDFQRESICGMIMTFSVLPSYFMLMALALIFLYDVREMKSLISELVNPVTEIPKNRLVCGVTVRARRKSLILILLRNSKSTSSITLSV